MRIRTLFTLVLPSICLFVGSLSYGQGTVNFSNLSTALSSPPDRLIRFGHDYSSPFSPIPVHAGQAASTNAAPNLVAQLYYGSSTTSVNSLVPVSTAPGSLRPSTSASAGTWFANGTRTLNGFNPGDLVTMQVRVWDITKGADYTQALQSGLYDNWFGTSEIFTYIIPTNPTPAPSEFNMGNFRGFNIIIFPEPTSLSLLGLAAALTLILRRRRR